MSMLGLCQGRWVGRVSVFLEVWLLVLHNDTTANPFFFITSRVVLVDKESSSNNGVFAPEILLEIRSVEVVTPTIFS